MHTRPDAVDLCEVGPRDGFQFEETPIPTDMKIRAIRDLAGAGLRRIQAVSFVHPDRVPQMADAEAVVAGLADLDSAVIVTGLALNRRGVDRAGSCGLRVVDLSIATNERHALDNANMSVEHGRIEAARMIEDAVGHGMTVQLGLQTVFGYREPGDTPLDLVLGLVQTFRDAPLESISLADSTGLAGPDDIRRVVSAVQEAAPVIPIVLHLHDTRGLGLTNLSAALELGIARFDTSLGGLGGCPFIPGATGNIATEDAVWLLDRLKIQCGVESAAVAAVSRTVADHLGRSLDGRLYRLL